MLRIRPDPDPQHRYEPDPSGSGIFIPDLRFGFLLQKRTSSTSKHEISNFFLPLFSPQDPDPDSGSGYEYTDLIKSGSNPGITT